MTEQHVTPVTWFARDPGGGTIYVVPRPQDDEQSTQVASREENEDM